MKNVLYFGHLGGRSYGDEIGLTLFQDYIAKHYKDRIRIHVQNIKAGEKLNIQKKYDFYLLGCGTCLSNLGRYYADQLLMQLSNTDMPYGVLGAGVYYENSRQQKNTSFKTSKMNNEKTKKYIDKAKFIAIRDEASRAYMLTLSPGKDIKVLYDPGLSVAYKKSSIKFKKPVLGFNIAACNRGCLGALKIQERQYDTIKEFIRSKKGQYSLMFVPFNKKDMKIGKRLAEKWKIYCCKYGSTRQIAGVTQNADIFVGIRVHADITCAAYGIPFLSITYTKPNINFLGHIEYNNFIEVNNINKESLTNGFKKLEEDKELISKQLKEKATIARQTHNELSEELCQIIMKV